MKNPNNNPELENFVKDNKNLFDTEMPVDGHFERFQDKLNTQNNSKFSYYKVLKFAAVIVLLLTSVFVFNDYFYKSNVNVIAEVNDDENFEDISYFYNIQLEEKNKEFLKLKCKEGKKEKQNVEQDIAELKKEYQELLLEYKKDPNNENLKNALISNYRLRIDTLGKVINSLNKYC